MAWEKKKKQTMKWTRNRQKLLVSWDKKTSQHFAVQPHSGETFTWENQQRFASHEWQGWWLDHTAGGAALLQEQHYKHRSHRCTRQGPVIPVHDSFSCLGTTSRRHRAQQYLKVSICQGTDVAQCVRFLKLLAKETIFGISGCLQTWLGLVLVYFNSN